MSAMGPSVLSAWGVDPRGFAALTRALIRMDLRGQHYATATGAKSSHMISPLFWVVGQCLTASAGVSLVLFMRVGVFFYATVGLGMSMLVIATTVLVEFHEVVLDPSDLEVIGPRPVASRTYAAARGANLLFYVALMFVALNLFPMLVGAGLRDAGPWYAPAYLAAALAGNALTVAAVILLLSVGGTSDRFEPVKDLLAWTQIVLILVVFYGAQWSFRDQGHGLQVWGAFPPWWASLLPPAWLARFVDRAADAPGWRELVEGVGLLGLTAAAALVTVGRLSRLYRAMQPTAVRLRRRPLPEGRLGGLGGAVARAWARGPEERAGYWLGSTMLARDVGLFVRCALPLNSVVAVVVLGLATGQFADPLVVREPSRVLPPILAVYLMAMAVPPIVFNLTFSRESEAFWVVAASPLARPAGLMRGACKAVLARVVLPMCVVLGLVMAVAWRDPLSAALHAALAASLAWPLSLVTPALVTAAPPLSRPLARGSSLGPMALPMAALSAALSVAVGLHCLFARSPAFWLAASSACVVASVVLARRVEARSARALEADR